MAFRQQSPPRGQLLRVARAQMVGAGAPVLLIEVDEAEIFHVPPLVLCPRECRCTAQIVTSPLMFHDVPNLSVSMPALFAQNVG
jgi:hypothetical protein